MKKLLIVLTTLFAFSRSTFAQMNSGSGSGMMGDGWGWGTNSVGFFIIAIVIAVILGLVFMKKLK